jgi:hypothetical protein
LLRKRLLLLLQQQLVEVEVGPQEVALGPLSLEAQGHWRRGLQGLHLTERPLAACMGPLVAVMGLLGVEAAVEATGCLLRTQMLHSKQRVGVVRRHMQAQEGPC